MSNIKFLLVITLTLFVFVSLARTLRITDVIVPEYVDPEVQKVVNLFCYYDSKFDDFTAMRWFRGGLEFFRYTPKQEPRIRSWNLVGVQSLTSPSCDEKMCVVSLSELTEEASGRYKCELAREEPPFVFVDETRVMIVKPSNGVKVELNGVQETYKEGDYIEAECVPIQPGRTTSLRWFVNQEEVKYMDVNVKFFNYSGHIRRPAPQDSQRLNSEQKPFQRRRSSNDELLKPGKSNSGDSRVAMVSVAPNGTSFIRMEVDRLQFRGPKAVMAIQCVEFDKYVEGRVLSSRTRSARWKGVAQIGLSQGTTIAGSAAASYGLHSGFTGKSAIFMIITYFLS